MNILVTGASGFMGKNLVARLAQDHSNSIWGITHQSPIQANVSSRVKYLKMDLSQKLTDKIDKLSFDVIFHMAAQIPVSFDDLQAAKVNRQIDDSILQICVQNRSRLVLASSSSIYSWENKVHQEDETPQPKGVYAREKLATEKEALQLAQKHHFPVVALRINAPYGPGQTTRNVLQIFMEKALKGEPLTYYGKGQREQDFTYIQDITQAFYCGLSASTGIYNISGGAPITMANLADLVVRITQSKSQIRPSQQQDPQEGVQARFSIDKAKKHLHWEPQVHLEMGIGSIAQYMREV